MSTFKFLENRGKSVGQDFDKDEIFVIKAGKKINCYEEIQNNREDTEIYPTLEKYGCLDRMQLTVQDATELYADLTGQSFELRDLINQQKKAEEMWNNLPLDVRREFNHSKQDFLNNGTKWLKNKIDTAKAAEEKLKQQATIAPVEPLVKPTTGVKTNE